MYEHSSVYFLRLQGLAESTCQLAFSMIQTDTIAIFVSDPVSDSWLYFPLNNNINWDDTLNIDAVQDNFKKKNQSWIIHAATSDWEAVVTSSVPYDTVVLVPQVESHNIPSFLVLAVPSEQFDISLQRQLQLLMQIFSRTMQSYVDEESYSRWFVKLWHKITPEIKSSHFLLDQVAHEARERFKADAVAIWPYSYDKFLTANPKTFTSFERGVLLLPDAEESLKIEWEVKDNRHYRTVEQIVEKRWLYIPDIDDQTYVNDIGEGTKRLCKFLGAHAFCGMTLHMGGAGARGILFLYYKQPNPIVDRMAIQRFSDYAALGIDTSWRRLRSHRLRSILNLMYAIAPLTVTGDRDRVLTRIAEHVRDSFECDIVRSYLYDPTRKRFYPPGSAGLNIDEFEPEDDTSLSGLLLKGIERKRPTYVRPSRIEAEINGDAPRTYYTSFTAKHHIRAYALVPLRYRNNPIGILFISYKFQHVLPEDQPSKAEEPTEIKSRGHVFSLDERDDIELTGNLVALALNSMQDFSQLGESRMTIGARVTQRWLGNVSATWGHEVTRYAAYINDRVKFIQEKIQSPAINQSLELYRTISADLKEIQDNSTKIQQMELFSLPLKIEETYTLIEIKRFLQERIRQWQQSTLYNEITFEWNVEAVSDEVGVQGDTLWLRWVFDIIVSYIRRLSESPKKHITIALSKRKSQHLWIEFHYYGVGLDQETRKRLRRVSLLLDPSYNPSENEFDLMIAQTILAAYQGDLEVFSRDGGQIIIVDLPIQHLD